LRTRPDCGALDDGRWLESDSDYDDAESRPEARGARPRALWAFPSGQAAKAAGLGKRTAPAMRGGDQIRKGDRSRARASPKHRPAQNPDPRSRASEGKGADIRLDPRNALLSFANVISRGSLSRRSRSPAASARARLRTRFPCSACGGAGRPGQTKGSQSFAAFGLKARRTGRSRSRLGCRSTLSAAKFAPSGRISDRPDRSPRQHQPRSFRRSARSSARTSRPLSLRALSTKASDRREHDVGAADREDRRQGGRAGGVDHDQRSGRQLSHRTPLLTARAASPLRGDEPTAAVVRLRCGLC